jgi:hypothetical protein
MCRILTRYYVAEDDGGGGGGVHGVERNWPSAISLARVDLLRKKVKDTPEPRLLTPHASSCAQLAIPQRHVVRYILTG